MLFDILALLSLLIVIFLLSRLANILPSLLACLIRWKETMNLEASAKLSRDRDALAMAMLLPFCLIAVRFRLYDPGYMDGMSENLRLGIICSVFVSYLFLRRLTFVIFRPGYGLHAYRTADRSSYSFFILLTLILLFSGGLLSFCGMNSFAVRDAMIWISAGIYLLFLVRKMQIFMSSYSIFTAFLYLCALEILPTGIMLVSAMIF
ncbi:MAG: DUF4271 domain-containing protein [Bacteroidales bacterium]|nr:DUF4271 domain-containing protein [Bacteroidales bacterium]MBQ6689278.1 DUF4271 domain-containing protein [Bacteroidales bacterium]